MDADTLHQGKKLLERHVELPEVEERMAVEHGEVSPPVVDSALTA